MTSTRDENDILVPAVIANYTFNANGHLFYLYVLTIPHPQLMQLVLYPAMRTSN